MRKLKLNVEDLRVEQFSTHEAPKERGTVEARCGTTPGPCWTYCDPYGQNASCWYTCNPNEYTCCYTCEGTCQQTCERTCDCVSITEYQIICECYPNY